MVSPDQKRRRDRNIALSGWAYVVVFWFFIGSMATALWRLASSLLVCP